MVAVLVAAAVPCWCAPVLCGGLCLVVGGVVIVYLDLSGLAAWKLALFAARVAMAVWLLGWFGWLLCPWCFVLVAGGLGKVVGLLIVLGPAYVVAPGLVIPGCLW